MRHERLERAEELSLRALGARERLHVVDEQEVEVAVALVELFEACVRLVRRFANGGRVLVDEVLRGDASDARLGVQVKIAVADRLHEVRLAEADAAVDVKRVVLRARRCGYVLGGGDGKLVGVAVDVVLESEAGEKPRLLAPPLVRGDRRSGAGLGGGIRPLPLGRDERNCDGLSCVHMRGDRLNVLQVRAPDEADLRGRGLERQDARLRIPENRADHLEPGVVDLGRALDELLEAVQALLPEFLHSGKRRIDEGNGRYIRSVSVGGTFDCSFKPCVGKRGRRAFRVDNSVFH